MKHETLPVLRQRMKPAGPDVVSRWTAAMLGVLQKRTRNTRKEGRGVFIVLSAQLKPAARVEKVRAAMSLPAKMTSPCQR